MVAAVRAGLAAGAVTRRGARPLAELEFRPTTSPEPDGGGDGRRRQGEDAGRKRRATAATNAGDTAPRAERQRLATLTDIGDAGCTRRRDGPPARKVDRRRGARAAALDGGLARSHRHGLRRRRARGAAPPLFGAKVGELAEDRRSWNDRARLGLVGRASVAFGPLAPAVCRPAPAPASSRRSSRFRRKKQQVFCL
jgi:hypothetical protein